MYVQKAVVYEVTIAKCTHEWRRIRSEEKDIYISFNGREYKGTPSNFGLSHDITTSWASFCDNCQAMGCFNCVPFLIS